MYYVHNTSNDDKFVTSENGLKAYLDRQVAEFNRYEAEKPEFTYILGLEDLEEDGEATISVTNTFCSYHNAYKIEVQKVDFKEEF